MFWNDSSWTFIKDFQPITKRVTQYLGEKPHNSGIILNKVYLVSFNFCDIRRNMG